MFGNILKTEVVGEGNGTHTINCIIDNSISCIDCSVVIDDEFGTEERVDEIDERNER